MLRTWLLPLVALVAWSPVARADQFEQLDGPTLLRTIKGSDATPRPSLTIGDLGAMPALLRDTRSALVLAKSGAGNPVRLLLAAELRKPGAGDGEPFPVLVIERLDSFDAADPATRLASRKDVVVYDGFRVDLDSGQVVPEGQGDDVVFRLIGEGGPRLESIAPAQLFTLSKGPDLDLSRPAQPTPGRSVVAGDFAGRYRLYANGQWSGTLDLKVEGRGVVTGRFRSDLHGSSYPVTGQVSAGTPQEVRFAIGFPRARQEFDGYLWGEGKGAMAGTASLLERTFGFFAVREGGRYAPEGRELGELAPPDAERPGRHLVAIGPSGLTLEGKPATTEAIAAALKPLVDAEADPAPWVLIQVDPEVKYSDLRKVIDAIEGAGIRVIRLEPLGPSK